MDNKEDKKTDSDLSLDDILSSIRSVVMNECVNTEKKQLKHKEKSNLIKPQLVIKDRIASFEDIEEEIVATKPKNTTSYGYGADSESKLPAMDKYSTPETINAFGKIQSAVTLQQDKIDIENTKKQQYKTKLTSIKEQSLKAENFKQSSSTAFDDTRLNSQSDSSQLAESQNNVAENTTDRISLNIDDNAIYNTVMGESLGSTLPSVNNKPFILTDIMELGVPNEEPSMVSGIPEYNVRQTLQELLDILAHNKDQLPEEFFEKQDEVIKSWLNQYLPEIVERQVQEEIRRISQYVRSYN